MQHCPIRVATAARTPGRTAERAACDESFNAIQGNSIVAQKYFRDHDDQPQRVASDYFLSVDDAQFIALSMFDNDVVRS